MMLLDQFGRPVRYIQKTAIEIDAAVADELRAEEAARSQAKDEAGSYVPEDPNIWAAHNRAHRAEQFVTPAEHARECAAARSAGHFEGIAEGKKAGASAEGKRFMAIVKGCTGARLIAALDMALEFPDFIPSACIDMAGRHFTYRGRGSASLALRDTQPDSLALLQAQLAGA